MSVMHEQTHMFFRNMNRPEAIVMMEDHDKAYYAWKERGVRGLPLVHVDAHIDFGWVPEMDLQDIAPDPVSIRRLLVDTPLLNPFSKPRSKMTNIGNYICPAMREGMVDTFYWAVPDESFRLPRGRRHIMKQLGRLLRVKQPGNREPEVFPDHIRCSLMGHDVFVCPLSSIPRIDRSALLDIDVDFMTTRHIWNDLDPKRRPWITSAELYSRLVPRLARIDMVTIAYSVEGGFTPLRFKYLGDELRGLFAGKSSPAAHSRQEALEHESRRRYDAAAAAYEQALRVDPADAAAYFNLALLHADRLPGNDAQAAFYYQEAVRRDRTYACGYNNYGIIHLRAGKLRLAEQEFRKVLRWDTAHTAALSGLGFVSLCRRRYDEADGFFRQCLALDTDHAEAMFGAGIVAFRRNRLDEAQGYFSRLTFDHPDDAPPYWWLGRIAQKQGDMPSAINCYKDAVMRGAEGPLVHAVLAYLYARTHAFFRAREELRRAFDVWRALV